MTGIIGGAIAIILLSWLAGRAQRDATINSGRFVLKYGRAVKSLGCICTILGFGFIYAAAHASKDQMITAACVSGALFAMCLVLFVEFYFVRIEFDEEFIYTFSPWRRKRVIPWNKVTGYSYSEVNRWHVLKTQKFGAVRLSVLLSGLGTMAEQLEKRGFLKKATSQ
jgi:hypothetical protein